MPSIKREDIQAELEKYAAQSRETLNSRKTFERDERYWVPVKDKAGTAEAIVRFLPPPEAEDRFAVLRYHYRFKWPATNFWYIHNSPSTLPEETGWLDPVMELNSKDWAAGPEGQERARLRKRQRSFISNIYVIRHEMRPEDEGKVFLWAYPKSVFEMIDRELNPPFKDMERYAPFSLEDGANFRLKIVKRGTFPDYVDSQFEKQSALPNGEAIWRKSYSLADEISPDKFESYEVLKKHLTRVLGSSAQTIGEAQQETAALVKEEEMPRRTLREEMRDEIPDGGGDEDESDPGAFFRNLASRKRSA